MNVEIKDKSMTVEYYSDTNDTIDKFMITKKPYHSILMKKMKFNELDMMSLQNDF